MSNYIKVINDNKNVLLDDTYQNLILKRKIPFSKLVRYPTKDEDPFGYQLYTKDGCRYFEAEFILNSDELLIATGGKFMEYGVSTLTDTNGKKYTYSPTKYCHVLTAPLPNYIPETKKYICFGSVYNGCYVPIWATKAAAISKLRDFSEIFLYTFGLDTSTSSVSGAKNGLQVYNSGGECVYDSNKRYMRVVSAIDPKSMLDVSGTGMIMSKRVSEPIDPTRSYAIISLSMGKNALERYDCQFQLFEDYAFTDGYTRPDDLLFFDVIPDDHMAYFTGGNGKYYMYGESTCSYGLTMFDALFPTTAILLDVTGL
nr:MAG TPA: hypothetical protein [Bacteriophage sp.]